MEFFYSFKSCIHKLPLLGVFEASYVELLFGPWYLGGIHHSRGSRSFYFPTHIPIMDPVKTRDFLYHDQTLSALAEMQPLTQKPRHQPKDQRQSTT